jgi:hypothetical protein
MSKEQQQEEAQRNEQNAWTKSERCCRVVVCLTMLMPLSQMQIFGGTRLAPDIQASYMEHAHDLKHDLKRYKTQPLATTRQQQWTNAAQSSGCPMLPSSAKSRSTQLISVMPPHFTNIQGPPPTPLRCTRY